MYTKQQYIDTLYLSWRFDDIVEIGELETEFFKNYGANYLGTSSGYNWFLVEGICRVGIVADVNNIFKAKLHAFVIQYDNRYLLEHTIDNLYGVLDLDTLVFSKDEAIVKRIDFSVITNNIEFFNLDVVSRYRSRTEISKNDVLETVYLGKRSNGKVFRYYRKDIELLQDKNLVKQDYFMQYFQKIDFSLPITVLELELHRKFLRDCYGFSYLKDIDKLLSIVLDQFTDIKFYEPTPENKKFVEQRNYSHIIYEYILDIDINKYEKVDRIVNEYSPSLSLLYSRLNKIVNKFCTKSGLKISKTEVLLNIFDSDIELERLSGMRYSELEQKYSEEDLYLIRL